MTDRKTYTKEYKEDALALAKSLGNMAEAARQLGVKNTLLYAWRRQVRPEPNAFSNQQEEIIHLRKEVTDLKKVNHILKSAAAFFSQDHLK